MAQRKKKKTDKDIPESPAFASLMKRFQVRPPGSKKKVEGLHKYEGKDFKTEDDN